MTYEPKRTFLKTKLCRSTSKCIGWRFACRSRLWHKRENRRRDIADGPVRQATFKFAYYEVLLSIVPPCLHGLFHNVRNNRASNPTLPLRATNDRRASPGRHSTVPQYMRSSRFSFSALGMVYVSLLKCVSEAEISFSVLFLIFLFQRYRRVS